MQTLFTRLDGIGKKKVRSKLIGLRSYNIASCTLFCFLNSLYTFWCLRERIQTCKPWLANPPKVVPLFTWTIKDRSTVVAVGVNWVFTRVTNKKKYMTLKKKRDRQRVGERGGCVEREGERERVAEKNDRWQYWSWW